MLELMNTDFQWVDILPRYATLTTISLIPLQVSLGLTGPASPTTATYGHLSHSFACVLCAECWVSALTGWATATALQPFPPQWGHLVDSFSFYHPDLHSICKYFMFLSLVSLYSVGQWTHKKEKT